MRKKHTLWLPVVLSFVGIPLTTTIIYLAITKYILFNECFNTCTIYFNSYGVGLMAVVFTLVIAVLSLPHFTLVHKKLLIIILTLLWVGYTIYNLYFYQGIKENTLFINKFHSRIEITIAQVDSIQIIRRSNWSRKRPWNEDGITCSDVSYIGVKNNR